VEGSLLVSVVNESIVEDIDTIRHSQVKTAAAIQ